jgi:plastocyanin
MKPRTLALSVMVVVGSVAMAGTSLAAPQLPTRRAAIINVSISEFMFSPDRTQVHVGDTIVWTNNGEVSHTTTARGGAWDSGVLTPGQTFSFTFDTLGQVRYRCQIHLNLMKGGVNVVP